MSNPPGFEDRDTSSVLLYYPEESGVGSQTNPGFSNEAEYWYFFPQAGLDGAPFNGDYILDINGINLNFYNISFYTGDEHTENIIIPQIKMNVDSTGVISSIEYRWRIILNGEYIPVSAEELEFAIWNNYIHLVFNGTTAFLSIPKAAGGIIDLEGNTINVNEISFCSLNTDDMGNNRHEIVILIR